jgi:hypothetical protein
LNLNPTNILILRHDPASFFDNIEIGKSEEKIGNEDELGSENKSNILLTNFCQAAHYTKKFKFNNQENTPI